MEKIRIESEKETCADDIVVSVPVPLTQNGFENSHRLRNCNSKPELFGFEADKAFQNDITDIFRYGYTARDAGKRIVYRVMASSIQVRYRKTVNEPSPVAKAVIDGDSEYAFIPDGNFEETWGDCLYTQPVLLHGEFKEHVVKTEIIKDHKETGFFDREPFILFHSLFRNDDP